MIATMLARIDPQVETAIQAIGSSTRQPLTEEVSQADTRRDNSFRSLRDHIEAGLRRQNDSYRTACEALWSEFEKNGLNLYSIKREKETAAIVSLINDLRQEKHEQHLKTTNITRWVQELEDDNQAYVSATQQRSAARSSDNTVKDTEAFKDLKASLDLLESVLNTLSAMGSPEGIAPVVDEIAQYIREANTAAKPGKTKADDENAEEASD